MNTFTRGFRNAFRNSVRTLSIVIILGLSIGLALTMLVARQAVEKKINTVKSTIGNTVSISPAGIRGFSGGGTPLTTAQLSEVATLDHITKVTETLSDRLTTSDSNLQSSITAGSFGQRQNAINTQANGSSSTGGGGGGGFGGGGFGGGTFTPPVTVVGTTDPTVLDTTLGGGSINITSGKNIDGNSNDDVAIVGKSLASKNNLSVGSTFTAYSTTITVVGIYDAGNTFSNSELVMPLQTVQRLSSQTGDVTSAVATVDSLSNLSTATSEISSKLGSAADVVSSETQANDTIQPLQGILSVSLYSLIGAVIAGAVIILLVMIMIVRERRREIGVFKAIGASNVRVMMQFMSEAVTFTIIGAILGLGLGVVAGSPVTNLLVTNSSSTTTTTTPGGGFGGRGGGFAGGHGFGGRTASSVRDIHAAVGWDLLIYGLLAAILIAVIGSAVASFLIAKVRPAEVMRVE